MARVGDLLHAIRRQDENGLAELLQAHREAAGPASHLDEELEETTALTEAVLAGRASMVNMLLDAGADVNKGSPDAVSPLAVAAAVNNLAMAKLLLHRGADTCHLVDNRPLCRITTPLHHAIELRNTRMADILLQHGHEPNCPSRMYKYPLAEAVRLNCLGIVQLLASHPRCAIDGQIDNFGTWSFPPLHQALFRFRRYEVAQALLDVARCRLSFQGDAYLCVLLWRAKDTTYHHLKMAQMLLEAGADMRPRDRQGQAPIESFITGNRIVDLAGCRKLLRMVVTAGITPSPWEASLVEDHVRTPADSEVAAWMRDMAVTPRSLQDQVRWTLRRDAGNYPMPRLNQLPLPPLLRDFVTLRYLRDYR